MVQRRVGVGSQAKRKRGEPFELRRPPAPSRPEKAREAPPPASSPAPVEEVPTPPPAVPRSTAKSSHSAPSPGHQIETNRSQHRHRPGGLEGEDAWTGSQPMSLWWVLAGILCLAVVGYFMSQAVNNSSAGQKLEEPKRSVMKDGIEDIPIADFVARSGEILPKVSALLNKAVAIGDEELSGIIRGGTKSMENRRAWIARKAKGARHHPSAKRQLHATAVGGTAYLILLGLDSSHLSAVAYFVEEEGEFKYDWEASEGYSDLLPNEVDQLADDEPKLMRVVVSLSNYYTTQFPEAEFRAYSLHHQDPGEFVWAFAKRRSVVDRQLITSYIAPDLDGTQRRATVRVRKGPEGARANQLEIVEFLHTDWFTPNEVSER